MLVTIETIDDLLSQITEGNGIILSSRLDHSVIDYVFTNFTNGDTLDSDLPLQCRGLRHPRRQGRPRGGAQASGLGDP